MENLIKESSNDAGLTAHPSGIWAMNANHFQLSMLAYNLNCWLALFQHFKQWKGSAQELKSNLEKQGSTGPTECLNERSRDVLRA